MAARHVTAIGGLQLVIEPADGVQPLVADIDAAQRSIDGEVYLASSRPVLAALEAAAARHIVVRIALDPHPYGTPRSSVQATYSALSSHGVQVHWTSPAFTYTHFRGGRQAREVELVFRKQRMSPDSTGNVCQRHT